MSMTPEKLAEKLHQALPDALHAVILYGSAAAGDYVNPASHYDVLVVTKRCGIAELDALSPAVRTWGSSGNRPPQVMTLSELQAATDAFPLEILDMQQAHRLLWGTDPLDSLHVKPAHLRLQLERELKGKQLLLRQLYLAGSGNRKRLAALMANSVTTFLVLMRGALRLYQETVPPTKVEAMTQLAGHITFDPEPFLIAIKFKDRTAQLSQQEITNLFQKYMAAIERIVGAIDRHIHQTPSQENRS